MSLQNKRRHKTLTLFEKNEIIDKLKKGHKLTELANEYGVGRATVHDIKKNGDKIQKFIMDRDNVKYVRKTLKSGKFPQVENSLYSWYRQEQKTNSSISGDILKTKAKSIYQEIMKRDDFQASDGWLDKFKKRFGIRFMTSTGEKSSEKNSSEEHFREKFNKIVAEMDLCADQIFSAGECELFWRLLPDQTESDGPEGELAEDRITFMVCSNASAFHKLDLLVIGEARDPLEFIENARENVNLPVVYKYESRACMTKSVFTEWFHEAFVPSVENFLMKNSLPQKALLLLNNTPGYPDENELKSKNGFVRVMFWPNTNPCLQPMDQNFFQTLKMHYKENLLHKISAKGDDIVQFLNGINLTDAVFSLSNAWENLSTKILVSSWQGICPHQSSGDLELPEFPEAVIDKSEDITLNDYKNLEANVKEEHLPIIVEEINYDVQIKEEEKEEDETEVKNSIFTSGGRVSHESALAAFTTVIKWAEENGVTASDILILGKLQTQASEMAFQAGI